MVLNDLETFEGYIHRRVKRGSDKRRDKGVCVVVRKQGKEIQGEDQDESSCYIIPSVSAPQLSH